MTKIARLLLFLCTLLVFHISMARPRVAVVLSGGGAKGTAHIGALKVIAGDDALDEPLTELQNTLNTAMTNVRTSVHDLHDDAIDLESTLWEIIDGVNTTKISLEYDVEGTLPNPIKYAFIAIVKEAVNNIQKHSNAKNASIRVCMHPGFYLLSIADNGTKISTTDSRGIGLSNMEERVRALNGVIRFDTENGLK